MTESQTSNSYIDSDFRSERFSARPLSAYSPNRPGCLPPFAIVAARILARAVFRAFARRRRGSRPEAAARVFVAPEKSRFPRAAELGHDSRTVHDSRATRDASRPSEPPYDPRERRLALLGYALELLVERAEPLEHAGERGEAVFGKRAPHVRPERGLALDQKRHQKRRVGLRDEPVALLVSRTLARGDERRFCLLYTSPSPRD